MANFFRPAPLAKIGEICAFVSMVGLVDRGPQATAWKTKSSLKENMAATDWGILPVVLAKKSAFRHLPRIKFVCQHRIILFVPKLVRVRILRLAHVDTEY